MTFWIASRRLSSGKQPPGQGCSARSLHHYRQGCHHRSGGQLTGMKINGGCWCLASWMPALLKKRIRTFSRGATPPTRSTKAAIAISSNVHDDIEMPESFIAMLPKSGQTSVGTRCITSRQQVLAGIPAWRARHLIGVRCVSDGQPGGGCHMRAATQS